MIIYIYKKTIFGNEAMGGLIPMEFRDLILLKKINCRVLFNVGGFP
jgi:hypothetical protein